MMPFFQSATLAVSTIDPTLSSKIERSPQYKDGKFVGNLNALNMSLADYASTTWDFLFTRNARTPDTDPMMRLTAAAESKNVKYATPVVGETTLYGKTIPATKWWEQAVELHSSSTDWR